MCYHSLEATQRAKTVHLSSDDFTDLSSRVLPYAHRLSLSLGNEPLMSPHFIEILKVASRYAVPNVNFFTNGLLLNDRNIDSIIDSGVTQLCVSMDGATPETYNSIRRDGDFDQLIRNLERLAVRRNANRSSTPRVRFDIVMMVRNVHELPGIVKLGAQLGIEQLSFRHMVPFEGLDIDHESLQHHRSLSDHWLRRALDAAEEWGLEVQSRPAFFGPASDGKGPPAAAGNTVPAPFAGTPYCPYPFFHISMGPGGHVLPCPHSHGEAPYGQTQRRRRWTRSG